MKTYDLINAILYTSETEQQGVFYYSVYEDGTTDPDQTSLTTFGHVTHIFGNLAKGRSYLYSYAENGLYFGSTRLIPEVTIIADNGGDRTRVELFLIEE